MVSAQEAQTIMIVQWDKLYDGCTYSILQKHRKGMWGCSLEMIMPELILER